MRIVKHKKKFRVIEGIWPFEKVLSVHPTKANAEFWIKTRSDKK